MNIRFNNPFVFYRLLNQIPEPIDIEEEPYILITETENKESSIENHKNKIEAKNIDIEENKLEFEEIYNSYENSDLDARNELQDLMSKSSGDCAVKSYTIR